MGDSVISLDKLKAFWHSQVHDEENWAHNMQKGILHALLETLQAVVEFVKKIYLLIISVLLTLEMEIFFTKLMRAAGLFAGSILLMCNYGDLMAI